MQDALHAGSELLNGMLEFQSVSAAPDALHAL